MQSNYKKMGVSILVGTIKFLKDHVFVFFMCVWKNILEWHNVKIFCFLDLMSPCKFLRIMDHFPPKKSDLMGIFLSAWIHDSIGMIIRLYKG